MMQNLLDRPLNVLVVDDQSDIREVLGASLQDEGYNVERAQDGIEALAKIESWKPDVVLLDIWMPGPIDGIGVLEQAKAQYPSIEFVMMSGHGTIETAVKAVKLGAWDFVEKPISLDKVLIIINNISAFQHEKIEKNALLSRLRQNIAIIGENHKMVALKQAFARIAPNSTSILITGPKGSGRRLAAQNIHYLSERAGRHFVELNCSQVPQDLLALELFGALDDQPMYLRKGKLEAANGGTLLLHDLGGAPIGIQQKLLRYLETGLLQREKVQQIASIPCHTRVVVIGPEEPVIEVQNGRWLPELYEHLNKLSFAVPALCERISDLSSLIVHFSEYFSRESGYELKKFHDSALRALASYPWPGNVRELRNFIERIYILFPDQTLITDNDLVQTGLRIPLMQKEFAQ